jgi:hypothetical protein
MQDIEILDDATLDHVQGGLSFNLGFDTHTGLSASGPLGSIQIPSPITVAKDLFGGITSQLGDFLTKFGNRLSGLGQLFNFS